MSEIPRRLPESNPSFLVEMTKKVQAGYYDNAFSLHELASVEPKDRQNFLKSIITESIAGYKSRLEKFKIKYDQTPEEDRDFLDQPSVPSLYWLSSQKKLEGLNLPELYQIAKKVLLEPNFERLKITWSNIVLSKDREKFNVSAEDLLEACRCAIRNGFSERFFEDPSYLKEISASYRIQLGDDIVAIIDAGECRDVAVKAVNFLFSVPYNLADEAVRNPQAVDDLHNQIMSVWKDVVAKIAIACLKDNLAGLTMARRYDDLREKFPQLSTYSFDHLISSIKNKDEQRQVRELFAARFEEYKNPPATDESMSEPSDE